MYILAIETTGAYASVALLQAVIANTADARILGVIHGNDRFSHLQNLTPQIDEILKQNDLSAADMTAVAVSHGPGSFTGIRIGVSTARALAQVLDIPCIPVSSLEALALRSAQDDRAAGPDPAGRSPLRLICPVLDARRRQVYGAAYEIVDGEPVCRIAPASCLMTEFLQKLDGYLAASTSADTQISFIGDGIDTCGDLIRDWEAGRPGSQVTEPAMTEPGQTAAEPAMTEPGQAVTEPATTEPEQTAVSITFAPRETRYQDAATVALRGAQLYRAGRSCHYMDLQPEYLRMAEAERKLREKNRARQAFEGESES